MERDIIEETAEPNMFVIPERVVKSMMHNEPESDIIEQIYAFNEDRYNPAPLYGAFYLFCSYIHKSPYKILQSIAEELNKKDENDYFNSDVTAGDIDENLDKLINKLVYSYFGFLEYENENEDEMEVCYFFVRTINVVQYILNNLEESDKSDECSENAEDSDDDNTVASTDRLEVTACKGKVADTADTNDDKSDIVTVPRSQLKELFEILGAACDKANVPVPQRVEDLIDVVE